MLQRFQRDWQKIRKNDLFRILVSPSMGSRVGTVGLRQAENLECLRYSAAKRSGGDELIPMQARIDDGPPLAENYR